MHSPSRNWKNIVLCITHVYVHVLPFRECWKWVSFDCLGQQGINVNKLHLFLYNIIWWKILIYVIIFKIGQWLHTWAQFTHNSTSMTNLNAMYFHSLHSKAVLTTITMFQHHFTICTQNVGPAFKQALNHCECFTYCTNPTLMESNQRVVTGQPKQEHDMSPLYFLVSHRPVSCTQKNAGLFF